MNLINILAALGVPALVGLISTAYIQARQAKRPQNILREMLSNRTKADLLNNKSLATQEVLNGLDRLLAVEIDYQLKERKIKQENPKLYSFSFLIWMYAVVFTGAVLYLLILDIFSDYFFIVAFGTMSLICVVLLVILFKYWSVQSIQKGISNESSFYDSTSLESRTYESDRAPTVHQTAATTRERIKTFISRMKQEPR